MKPITQIPIPKYWTGDEATAVLEFLDDINTAIWNAHEEKILNAMKQQHITRKHSAKDDGEDLQLDDDLPF